MATDLSAYKTLYLETARKLVKEYVDIKSSSETDYTIDNLLRIFHSLKGQSMAMGYKNIAVLSLQVETLCKTLNENKRLLTPALNNSLPPQRFSTMSWTLLKKQMKSYLLLEKRRPLKN